MTPAGARRPSASPAADAMTSLLPDTNRATNGGSRARSALYLGLGAALVFAIAAGRIIPPTAGIGIACLALAIAIAARHPGLVVFGGMIAIAVIPIYWGPVIPHTHVGLLPVFGVCVVLFPTALRELGRFRLVSVDWLMLGYVAMRALGSLVNSSRGAGSALEAILYAALPYSVFRLVGLYAPWRRVAAVGVVCAGVISSIFAIREYGGTPNPFFRHFPNGAGHSYWVRVDYRFHRPRPEASFGHADALGLFLAFATLLALALAWREQRLAWRIVLYASALVCLQGIADTLERGPFVLLLVALPIILIVEARQGHSWRTLAALVVAAAILALTPIGGAAFRLRAASQTGGRLQASAQDRYDTIKAITDTRYFSLLGHDQGDDPDLSVQTAVGISTGLGAIENAFMFTYVIYGALAAAAFAGIAVPMTRAAFSARFDLLDRSWMAIVVSSFVIFLSVSFASQFAHFFWIALGIATAAAQPEVPEPSAAAADRVAVAR